MSSKPLVRNGLILVLLIAILLLVLFNPWKKAQPAPAAVGNPVAQPVIPISTIVIPQDLKSPLTAFILEVLNVNITETEESSMGDEHRRTGPALIKLKKAVFSVIEEEVKNMQPGKMSECQGRIQMRVKEALDEAKGLHTAVVGENKEYEFYEPIEPKHIYLIEIMGYPDLLVAMTSAEVVCGGDDSFYVFRKGESGYRLILKLSNEDPETRGFEGLNYVFSTSGNSDDFFVVLKYGGPNCTSCWGGVNFLVLRPGTDAENPVVVFNEYGGYYRCGGMRIIAGKSDFSMTYTDGQSLDVGVLTKTRVRHFLVENDKAVLIDPLGNFPEDFLDEWINISWDDAKRFCSKSKWESLKILHEKLQNTKVSFSFKFIQPCGKADDRWEIGLDNDENEFGGTLYFEIGKENGNFILKDIRKTRTGDCPGESQPVDHRVDMG